MTVQSRVKPALKERAEAVFSATGLSPADAIRMFLQHSVNVGGLPFRPTAKLPNAATLKAMEEVAHGKGKKFSKYQGISPRPLDALPPCFATSGGTNFN